MCRETIQRLKVVMAQVMTSALLLGQGVTLVVRLGPYSQGLPIKDGCLVAHTTLDFGDAVSLAKHSVAVKTHFSVFLHFW